MNTTTVSQADAADGLDADDLDIAGLHTPLESVAMACRQGGLLMPPIPREVADELKVKGPFRFASHEDDLDDLEVWQRAARRASSPPGVSFAHSGYGFNAWRLSYSLVLPGVAAHVVLPFGGAFGDHQAQAGAFNLIVERLEELIVLAEVGARAGKLRKGERLMVAVSAEGGAWAFSGEASMKESTQPFDDALRALSQRSTG